LNKIRSLLLSYYSTNQLGQSKKRHLIIAQQIGQMTAGSHRFSSNDKSMDMINIFKKKMCAFNKV